MQATPSGSRLERIPALVLHIRRSVKAPSVSGDGRNTNSFARTHIEGEHEDETAATTARAILPSMLSPESQARPRSLSGLAKSEAAHEYQAHLALPFRQEFFPRGRSDLSPRFRSHFQSQILANQQHSAGVTLQAGTRMGWWPTPTNAVHGGPWSGFQPAHGPWY